MKTEETDMGYQDEDELSEEGFLEMMADYEKLEKLQEQYPTPMLQGWAFLMGGIMFSLIFRPWQIDYVPTAMGAFGIFIVVVLGNVLAFSLYMSGVPLIGPQKASLYSFAEPVTAAIISTLVLGSSFTLWDALGFGCIFLMLVLLSLPAKQKN